MTDREDLYLFYHRDANVFTDFNGQVIYDMCRIISPNELYMFRHHPGKYSQFWHRSEPNILCRILTVRDDEEFGWYLLDINEMINYDYCYSEIERRVSK